MNPFIIAYIIGTALIIEGALMLLPIVCALVYKESITPFVITIAICLGLGFVMRNIEKHKHGSIRSKEAYVSTGLTWIVMSLTGMLPFLLSGSMTNAVDAFFETVSGFTTTGASILTDVEALPHGVLMWRSQMHWIGGMGILVFMLALIPISGGTQMNLFKAESPGPSISKLVPHAQDTAKILYSIYTALTALTMILLIIFRMPAFDAICIAFGAAGTGGFGVLNSSCADYTVAQQIIITVAMAAFGINFNFYFFLLIRKFKDALHMEEVRIYIGIIIVTTILITESFLFNSTYDNIGEALLTSAFHVSSIITTTGYGTTDMNTWPLLSQMLILLLMFVGACAGSTGGGLKVSRAVIMFKAYKREIATVTKPDTVKMVHMDGKCVDEDVVRSTSVYFFIYIIIMAVSILLISFNHFDFLTTFSSVIATFNNIGPGFGVCGSAGNYSAFSNVSKLILSADMLIGRLEIFPIMVLFLKSTWKKF